jgi:hypothetical protein
VRLACRFASPDSWSVPLCPDESGEEDFALRVLPPSWIYDSGQRYRRRKDKSVSSRKSFGYMDIGSPRHERPWSKCRSKVASEMRVGRRIDINSSPARYLLVCDLVGEIQPCVQRVVKRIAFVHVAIISVPHPFGKNVAICLPPETELFAESCASIDGDASATAFSPFALLVAIFSHAPNVRISLDFRELAPPCCMPDVAITLLGLPLGTKMTGWCSLPNKPLLLTAIVKVFASRVRCPSAAALSLPLVVAGRSV